MLILHRMAITMYKRKIDLHVHTDNSPDGNHSAMFMCERAEMNDLRAIAFCDHCEVDSFYEEHYDKRIRQAYYEMAKSQSAFTGKILVIKGIELAQPHYVPSLAKEILTKYSYDEVIGSVHNLRGKQDFYFMESFTENDAKLLFDEYLDEMLLMLEWGDFDILAHLTYPLRYFFSKSQISIDINDYKNKIDEILKLTAEKEKSLEINTAGLRQPIGKLAPEFETVKRFKELGGKFVSFGSDAHFADDIAKGLDEAFDVMKAAGFTETTFFQQRTPLQMVIE